MELDVIPGKLSMRGISVQCQRPCLATKYMLWPTISRVPQSTHPSKSESSSLWVKNRFNSLSFRFSGQPMNRFTWGVVLSLLVHSLMCEGIHTS